MPDNSSTETKSQPAWRALTRTEQGRLEARGLTCESRQCQGAAQYLVSWHERWGSRIRKRMCASHWNGWHYAVCQVTGQEPKRLASSAGFQLALPDGRPLHRKAPRKVWRCACRRMNEHADLECPKCGRGRS